MAILFTHVQPGTGIQMQQVRFIHAADLHLDAAFSGISREAPSDLAMCLQQSTFVALTRLVELCEREHPDFLLLAGDIYNVEDQSLRAQLAVRDACVRLDKLGIPVLMVHGNHDPLSSQVHTLHWPDCVTIFGEEVGSVPVGQGKDGVPLAMVYGVSHASVKETRNLAARFQRGMQPCLHVGILHAAPGDADGTVRYAPFSQEDLIASGMDYWALGHIHDRREICRKPPTFYPGCTQGLHINECGEKGCLLVTMTPSGEGWETEVAFHALGPVQWEILDIPLDELQPGKDTSFLKGAEASPVSEITSLDALEERIRHALADVTERLRPGCETLIVRLRLTGRTALNNQLRRGSTISDLLERLREPGDGVRIWIKDMEVLTRPPMNRHELTERDDLLGEIFRLGDAGRMSPERLEVLKQEALAPLFSHSRLRRVLEPLTQEETVQLLDDAESLCMDLLEND